MWPAHVAHTALLTPEEWVEYVVIAQEQEEQDIVEDNFIIISKNSDP